MKDMRIEDFGMAIAEDIRLVLGSEYSIEYKEVGKNNGVNYHALLIRKNDENIAPTIYIDGFFDEYEKGAEKAHITRDILRLYREYAPKKGFDGSFYIDFSNVCSHLTFKVTNYGKNEKALSDIPYKKLEDLALVPICIVSDDLFGDGNITIKNEHLKVWEISFDELWENVWENAPLVAPVKYRDLFEVVGDRMGAGFFDLDDMPKDMYVVSNTQDVFGAAAVFYPGFLDKLSEELESDLVVLPSSVHETIVMRAPEDRLDIENLIYMVKEVNRSVIRQEDYLSDSVYLYSREDKKISAVKE